jgi:dihydrofolate reductase
VERSLPSAATLTLTTGDHVSKLRLRISTSLDGFVAGRNQSVKEPLGVGGERLHEWVIALESWRRAHGQEGGDMNESTAVMERELANIGATIMGRNMFGGGPGPWSTAEPWTGWWGRNPPFHDAVFVLTHHAREPLSMQGGTTFFFVTDGIESTLKQASQAANGKDVALGGGAKVFQQYLVAGLIDEMEIHIVPLFLSRGAHLFDNFDGRKVKLESIRAIAGPGVTHLKYRVLK